MADTSPRFAFSGHETFPFRYPWMKKGHDAVCADGEVFNRDDALTTLGVGKNMVRSIRHWCLATGVVEAVGRGGVLRSAPLGRALFGPAGLDPYMEDPATPWILHWRAASNAERCTTWHWAFGQYHEPVFTRESLGSALWKWVQTLPSAKATQASLRRDIDCFLRCYVPARGGRGQLEDTLDCPLAELGLIRPTPDGRAFQFVRGAQEGLPDGALLYAVMSFWERFAPMAQTLLVDDLIRQPGGPGKLFKLDESSLAGRLLRKKGSEA